MESIKRLRNEMNLTQEGFAKLCGVSRASITRYEKGRPMSRENIERIARACGLSMDAIIELVKKEEEDINGIGFITQEEKEAVKLFHGLPREKQRELLDLLRTVLKVSHEKPNCG